jgi:hypothetical protein
MIFEKSVEVEMGGDVVAAKKKQEELKSSFAEDMKKCVGKRVTDGTLTCIRNAKTPNDMSRCGR